MHINNKKLGYYLCNGIEFSSKIKACIYSSQVNKPLIWYFNEKEFKNYDWTNEPVYTLDQLYDKRSKEIREKYDYIILSYSGGSDSNNILESFIRQGLLIDEIVVNHMQKFNKLSVLNKNIKDSWNSGAEFELQTINRLQYIKNASPKTKITVLDVSDNVFNTLRSSNDGSWVENRKEPLNVSGATRYNYIHFKEIRNKFDRSKSIGLILGIEKPRTYIKQNKFYILFTDKSANIASADEYLFEYDNANVEYFYWDPSAIPIMCKQAHVIKRWLEAFPQYKPLWTPKDKTDLFIKHRLIHEKMYRSIIYTTWNDDWYQADKATKDWYSELDTWFLQEFKDTKEFYIWKEGLNYVAKNANNFLIEKENIYEGLKPFINNYFIGDIQNV